MSRERGPQPVLILLNGELPSPRLVRSLARKASAVVCADGGVRHAVRLGIRPDIVIGDMDSLPAKRPAWKGTTYLYDADEGCSDFEKALRFACRLRGVGPLWIAGVLGGRMDHSMVNLALAEEYSRSAPVVLVHDGTAWLAGPGRYELEGRKGRSLTLSPVSERCVVSAKGLRFPLKKEALPRGSRGLSNRAVSKTVRLTVHRGRLWVVQPGEKAG